MRGAYRKQRVACLFLALFGLPSYPFQAPSKAGLSLEPARPAGELTLHYGVEWRLVRAGNAKLTWAAESDPKKWAALHLESTGIVSKLYTVNDEYNVSFREQQCASEVFLKAHEGKRQRETRVTFDPEARKASYIERDLVKDAVVLEKQIDIPECVHDVVGGLSRLRNLRLEPGQTTELPITDGKKLVLARIDAQEREEISTPAGRYKTIRYEAHLFNDVLYRRKGRLFVWVTDDERRLPVQIRVRLQFHVGTITLQLEKEERT
ncbi:MAG: DUF3108 domain-containing protein [Bryobacteraceae bacterium]